MKLSVTMYTFHKEFKAGTMNIRDFINFCGGLGLEGIELVEYFWKDQPGELKEIPSLLEQNNLDVAAYGVGNNFCHSDSKKRQEQIAYVKEGIDVATELGAPILRVFGGSLVRPEDSEHPQREKVLGSTVNGAKISIDIDELYNMVIESLEECTKYAGKKGIILALENHGGIPGTSKEIIRVLNGVSSEYLRALIDIGNFFNIDQDPVEGTKDLVPYVAHVHFKDLKKVSKATPGSHKVLKGDYNVEGVITGDGDVDLETTFKTLLEEDYKGFFSLEFERSSLPAISSTRASIRYARSLLSRLESSIK